MNEQHASRLSGSASVSSAAPTLPRLRWKVEWGRAGGTPALPAHIRLARPPSTRKKSFLCGGLCGARPADSLAVKDIEARGDHDRRSHQRIGVRHIAEYRIA